MKILLIQKVEKLGEKGEIKDVKEGYARNFLIPKKMAVLPTDPRAKEVYLTQKEEKAKKVEKTSKISELAESINGKKYTFSTKTDKKGKLYGSIGPKEISAKIGVEEKFVKQHFKELGSYDLTLDFDQDHQAKVKIVVEKEK